MKNHHKKIDLSLIVILTLLFSLPLSAHAVTETIQYGYDNDTLEVLKTTYDDDTEVEYVYDNMGNRLVKTTTLTGAPANTPPNPVSNPSIADGTIDVFTFPALAWTGGGDPDGDPVVYYIYLGESTTPTLFTSTTQTSFTPYQLKSYTTYYWRVVTKDSHNASTDGPLWSFTTGNSYPVASFTSNVTMGGVPLTVSFQDTSTDPDNDPITSWQWDFDGDSVIDSTEQHPSHTYTVIGNYTVSLTVTDSVGDLDTKTVVDYISSFDDADGDNVHDGIDNCINVYNDSQTDLDGDGIGDVCDPDTDGDGVNNDVDVCPYLSDDNSQADSDGDGYGDACTNQPVCVSTSAGLQTALTTAVNNGLGDVIQLVQGTYSIADNNNASFYHTGGEAENLVIEGGYTENCITRNADPSNTILDGVDGSVNVLDLTTGGFINLSEIKVDGVTVLNGKIGVKLNSLLNNVTVSNSVIKNNNNPDASTAGLRINASRGIINLHNNIIRDNTADSYTGVYLSTSSGGFILENNVIAGNITNNFGAGIVAHLMYKNSTFDLTNNTIVDNKALVSWGYGGGLYLIVEEASFTGNINNNIFWNNEASDSGGDIFIYNGNSGTINAYNNVYDPEKVFGTFTSEGNNINIDPLFVDAANGDYHLTSSSPLIDEGSSAAPLLPASDYEGDARVLGIAPDIGADEYYTAGTTYSISGQIMFEGSPLVGTAVSLTGDASITKLTDSNGNYRFTWLGDGNYAVTPVDVLYGFTPADIQVTVAGADVIGQDFAADYKDTDGDTIYDHLDNCPYDANTDQADADGDGYGDVCDLPGSISGTVIDEDTGVGIPDVNVRAFSVNNSFNRDADTDANGNYTITGLNNDDYRVTTSSTSGYLDEYYDDTTYTYAANVAVDVNQDTPGIDFALTPDTDDDGIADSADNCPYDANAGQEDMDGDNVGDHCDDDIDGDGFTNDIDVCPLLANDNNQQDTDSDGYGDACTVDHCVTTSSELQAALDIAETNSTDNVVKLVQGTYGVSGNNNSSFLYYPNLLQYNRLVIRGGYTTGCVSRLADASNTILDGEGISTVLTFNDFNGYHYPRWMLVEGVTVQNGFTGIDAYSTNKDFILRDSIIKNNVNGVRANTSKGRAILINNLIQGNSASYYAGVKAITSTGEIVIASNIITGNTASDYGGGIYVFMYGSGGFARIVNNTVTENVVTKSSGYGGGVYLSLYHATSVAELYNNILRGNSASSSGGDIYIDNTVGAAVNAFNNNFDPSKVSGTFTSEGNNINVDPLFVDSVNGDYHLSSGSPCIDEGDATAPSLSSTDYEGDARVLGIAPDIGADEYYTAGTTYIVSGQVLFQGSPLAGIKVDLTGDATATKITNDNGNYRFTWLVDGSYAVMPQNVLYDFAPPSYAVSVSGADATGKDFTANYKDTDGDTIYDHLDNCPYDANTDQADADGDGYGDVCDLPGSISGTVVDEVTGLPIEGIRMYAGGRNDYTDVNGSYTLTGVNNGDYTVQTFMLGVEGYLTEYYDNVPSSSLATPVPVLPNQDTPGIDFSLTPDTDNDLIADVSDNCPFISNAGQEDMDGDNVGDHCDPDIDGDGYNNDTDVCPLLQNDNNQADTDGDGYGDACTVDICITAGDSSGIQSALNTAKNSDSDYVLKLEQGTYNLTSQLSYMSTKDHTLVIRGGYAAGCATRVADASNTILDGGGSQNILYFSESNASGFPQHIKVEGITVQNGLRGMYLKSSNKEIILIDSIIRDNDNGSGYVGGVDVNATYGSLIMLNNIIESNRARYNAGLRITSLTGELIAANNIITGNKATGAYGGGVSVTTAGEAVVRILNNTIAGNMSSQNGGGLYLEIISASVDIYNNIISGNTSTNGGDIYIHGVSTGAVNAYNNNFDPAKVYGTFTSEGNNINVDPSFVTAGYWDNDVWVSGDYHLTSDSPCINAGDISAPSLPVYDFDGEYRVIGLAPDIGADEHDPVGWHDVYWQHRQEVTISSTITDGDLGDFPLLVKITDPFNEVFSKARFNGDDILFTLSDGTTQLDHEIEIFDITQGSEELVAWVRMQSISSAADTIIYMYYGNAVALNQENIEGVWDSSHVMVQHLNETFGPHYDSTANQNDSSLISVTSQGTVAGKIGGADEFDAIDDYINIPDPGVDSPLDLSGGGSITLSAWIYARGPGENPAKQGGILDKSLGGTGYTLRADGSNCTAYGDITAYGTREGNWVGVCGTANNVTQDSWDHVVYVYESSTFNHYMYVNGVLDNTANWEATSADTSKDLHIGEWLSRSFDGFIDEVRISSTNRSEDWINASYNNQSNPQGYVTFGAEELSPVPLAGVITDPATNVTENSATLNATVNPNGSDTTVYFEWGADTTYGNTTTAQAIGNGTVNVSVTDNIMGLLPDVTYHYRVVASNDSGMSYGSDMSFRTSAGTLGWYDPVWQHRQGVTVSSTMADGDLGDFPLLVKITDPFNEVFSKARFNGDDILFTLSDGTTQLDHEIEIFDITQGSEGLVAWVRVPGIASSTDTTIYMYYGNAVALNQENIEGVWDSSHVMVQHLNETFGPHYDSTVNQNDSSLISVTAQGTVAGKIGGADEFDAIDDYINIPDPGVDSPLDLSGGGSITLSAWIYARGPGENPAKQGGILDKSQSGTGYTLRADGSNCTAYGDITAYGTREGNWVGVCGTANNVTQDSWDHVVYIYDASTFNHYMYINGVLDNTANWEATSADTSKDLRIGEWLSRSFDGFIDEVRISSTDRSVYWIKASYNNQSNPQGYLTFGAEELSPMPLANITADPATSVTESSATFNATVNPNGSETTVYFEWGADTTYGNTEASQVIGSGTTGIAVSDNITGLLPDITYHYRMVATNGSGTSYGDDVSFTTNAVSLGWHDVYWQHRQEVTISSTITDGDLGDFPLLVKITDPLNEVFAKAQVDGDDILFTLSDGTTQLDHEIEMFDVTPGSEEMSVWVRAPGLSSSIDTAIYMYYSYALAANQENIEGVWDSSHVLVQHLSEASGQHFDSTANQYDSNIVNVTQQGQTITAMIGGADEFDAIDDYINIPDPGVDSPLDLSGGGSITLSAWIYARGPGENPAKQGGILDKSQSGTGYTLRADGSNCTAYGDITAYGTREGNWVGVCGTANNVTQDSWDHVVYVYDASTFNHYMYVNGVLDNTFNWEAISADTSKDLHIGEWLSRSFDGYIDEVRISSTDRAEDWIKASYNNQSNPQGYVTFGAEEIQ